MDEYKSGQPKKPGWYDVLRDGEDDRLQWFICMLNPKKRYWKDKDGNVVSGDIKWCGEPEARY